MQIFILVKSVRFHYLYLIWLLLNVISTTDARSADRMTRFRCPNPESIPNGSYRLRKNNMRINCRPGFTLQGPVIVDCVNGKWYGQKPVCAKRGCHINLPNPEHGIIQMDNDFRMVLFCLDNYKLAGNRFAYCNGTHWDRDIGNCREPSYNIEHQCDFETDDYCGWAWEETIGTEWKRVTAANIYLSYRTGPRHDHTIMSSSGGHYMLMETVIPESHPALLLSPVYERDLSLKTACCFRFYYFMYGSGVGDLKVYVRPVSIVIKDLLTQDEYLRFHKSGNQNNLWNEAHFNIGELTSDFQIIFVATAGQNHLSDIAIDDVKLMTGEDCRALEKPNEDDDDSASDEVTDEILIDTQSCRGRCLEQTGAGYVRKYGLLYGRCNCHAECEEDETCCPDFRLTCLSVIFEQTTEVNEYQTPNISMETTRAETDLPMKNRTASIIITTVTTPSTTSTAAITSTTNKTTTTTKPTVTSTRKKTTTTTKRTTPATTTTMRTTPSTTTTMRTTPSTTTTKRTTPSTTTTKRTTTKRTTPKPKIMTTTTRKPTFVWKTTTRTSTSITPTTKRQTPATFPTTRKTTLETPISKPITPRIIPIGKPNESKLSKSGKQEIFSWNIDNSSKEYKSSANRILLTALILLLLTVIVSTAYQHYKEDVKAWYLQLARTENGTFGDVETTSIRAKFRAKTSRLSTSSTVMSIKSRLGIAVGRDNEDMNCLIDADNDFDNDASLSIENPTIINAAKGPKSSLSTNL